tara:strand:- start:14 stop:172 length:159 start_codon:yes stop_codon:yes gene_type:complete
VKGAYMYITYKELKTLKDSLDDIKDEDLKNKLSHLVESNEGALEDEIILKLH